MSSDGKIEIVLEVTDNASGQIAEASSKISDSLKNIENAQNSLSQSVTSSSQAITELNNSENNLASVTSQVSEEVQRQSINYKNLAVSVSGVATASFSLYMSYDMIEKAAVQVDRSQVMVKSSANSAEKAQQAYNEAVAKYGPNSKEAEQKATDLGIAQERASVAAERATMAENNYSNAIARGALSVIPGVITLTASLGKTVEALSTSTSLSAVAESAASWAKMLAVAPTATLTAAMWGLNAAMDANPIAVIILAIAGLVAAFVAAYTYIKPFRDAVNEVGKALTDALKPAIDVIYGALKWLWDNVLVPLGNFLGGVFIQYLKDVAAAIKWVADGIGAFASWVGDSWAKMTGTFTDSVTKAMADQLKKVEEGLAKQTETVNKKYDDMVSTTEKAYEDETKAAIDSWNSRLTQEVTGWDKVLKTANEQSDALVDKITEKLKEEDNAINDNYDVQLKDLQNGYNDQLDVINGFYDDVIAITQDKLDQIRGARSKDLDDLELNYLLQKQAMEKTLEAQGTNLTEEQKQSVMMAIQQQYNDKKSAISDDYRIKELQAEKANDANIEKANKERADALAAAAAAEAANEVKLLNDKNAKLSQAERDANSEIAKINRDRNATIKEIEADRDSIEKQHTEDLKTIATQREKDLTAIARQGALDRYNIIKAANDKLGITTPAYNPASPTGIVSVVPSNFVGPLAPGEVYEGTPEARGAQPTPPSFHLDTALAAMSNVYSSAKGPEDLAAKLKTIVSSQGGTYSDALATAEELGRQEQWSIAQLAIFESLIQKFAEGGIVNSPTLALIGEGGVAERVQPLSRFSDSDKGLSQNNTIYVHISIGNISSEVDLDVAKAKILGGVVDGVGRRK